jgi:hypothetical protein
MISAAQRGKWRLTAASISPAVVTGKKETFAGGWSATALRTPRPPATMQVKDSFTYGIWFARSADFYNKAPVQLLGNLRAIPDTIVILAGVLPLTVFLFLTYRHIKRPQIGDGESTWEKAGISIADD